jgi:hypothetical protein
MPNLQFAIPLYADAGIPMIMLTYPAMLILLIPVILVEAYVCRNLLGLTKWEALKSSALANGISTILGIPLAWGILLALGFVTYSLSDVHMIARSGLSPIAQIVGGLLAFPTWLGPVHNGSWIIPGAVLMLLVPFFFASWGIEYLVFNYMLGRPDGDPSDRTSSRIRVAVRNANLITYGLMVVGTSIWLIIALVVSGAKHFI